MFLRSNRHRAPLSSLSHNFAACFAGLLLAASVTPVLSQQSAATNPARITQLVDDSVLTTLKGNVHPLARPEFDRGPADPSLPAERMQLVLKRSDSQEFALRQFLGSVQDKNSGQYRKWLTPEQFGARFGAAEADIETVSAWLESQGFKVNKVNKARTVIEFSGSVGHLQSAFHTQLHSFNVRGVQHLANVADPRLPSALAPVVAGLANLNDFFPKPAHLKPKPAIFDKATGKFSSTLTLGSPSQGYNLYVTPADAATIYDTPNSSNLNFTGSTSYTGTGVTIGIIGLSDIDLTNVANYRNIFGLPAATPAVIVDGNDPGVDASGASEAILDLEMSGGLAPGATQSYYTAANTNLSAGFFLAINRALDDNLVSIVSLSLEECELFLGSGANSFMYSEWEQAAAQGITAVVSSSDSGSAGCDNFDTSEQAQYGLQVNGLSSTPFNISVGGTDFDVLSTNFTKYVATTDRSNYGTALGFIPEATWNDSTDANGLLSANTPFKDSTTGDTNIVAGSGGMSSCVAAEFDTNGNFIACGAAYTTGTLTGWAKPSWQTGGNLNIPNDGVRDLPDVSLFASDGSYGAGWLFCDNLASGDNTCAQGSNGFSFYSVGGTSASAPAFAGMLALISQSQGGARLGQANYVLYNLANQSAVYASAFHDVTVGNISVYCAAGSPDCGTNSFLTGYDTGTGYDLATGLGSVDVAQLIANWSKAVFTPSSTGLTVNGGTSPISITHGDTVTLSATVAGGSVSPSGDIAILSNANQQENTTNSNWLATYSLASGGNTGSQSYSNLPGGTYTVSANYGGDIDFAQSVSNGVQVVVAKEASVLSLFATDGSSNFQPAASAPYGSYFSLEAQPVGASQVSSQTPAPGTGSVVFTDSAGLPSGVSGSVAINSFGVAELPVYYYSTALHSIAASYAGDNSFNASTASVNFTITAAPTASTVTSSASTVSGGTFTITDAITPTPASGAVNPTGTVMLTLGGTTIGSGALIAAQDSTTGASLAIATITVNASSLAAGANAITASYGGDGNYTASVGTVSVTAGGAASAFALTSTTATASSPGQSGTSTITITPTNYTGTVNLTCVLATSPSGANATYSPACALASSAVKVTNGAATTTATFSTTAPTSGALAYPASNRWFTAAGGAALACVLFFGIPARRRGWRSMLSLLVSLVAMAGVGCGGSSHNNSTPGTTTGSYTFTVTGTDSVTSTVTTTTTVTLTVQ